MKYTSLLVQLTLATTLAACAQKSDNESVPTIAAIQTAPSDENSQELIVKKEIAKSVTETIAPEDPKPVTITLNQALEMMVSSSPEIAKANERVRQFSYYSEIAKKQLFPSIEVTTGLTYNNQQNGYQNYSVGFSQILWDGKYSATIQMNVLRQLAEEERARTIGRSMVMQTVARYLNLVKAQGALISSKAQYEATARVYGQVLGAWKLGLIGDQPKFEAEAAFNRGELLLQTATGATNIACIELLAAIGRPSELNLCNRPKSVTTTEVGLPVNENDAVQTALEKRPEIAIDLALVKAAEAGVSVARADFYPKVIVGASYGINNNPNSGGFSTPISEAPSTGFKNDWSVGVSVSIPLWDNGKKKKAVAAAQSLVYQAESDLIYTQRLVATEVLTNLTHLQTSKKAIVAAQASEVAAVGLYQSSLASYQFGTLSLKDLLDNVVRLAEAQRSVLEAKYNYVQTVINLKTSLGIENQP